MSILKDLKYSLYMDQFEAIFFFCKLTDVSSLFNVLI